MQVFAPFDHAAVCEYPRYSCFHSVFVHQSCPLLLHCLTFCDTACRDARLLRPVKMGAISLPHRLLVGQYVGPPMQKFFPTTTNFMLSIRILVDLQFGFLLDVPALYAIAFILFPILNVSILSQ